MTFAGPPGGPFDGLEGYGVLPVVASLAEVQVALGKARIPHQLKVLHKTGQAYLTLATGASGPSRAGGAWQATVYFNDRDRLTEVQVESPAFASAAEGEAAMAGLEKRYGPARKAEPEGTGTRYWTHVWSNPRVTLRASLTSDKRETMWVVNLAWRPTVTPPAPARTGPVIPGELLNPPPPAVKSR